MKAKDFTKNMKFVENIDSEISADRESTELLDQEDAANDKSKKVEPVVSPKTEAEGDSASEVAARTIDPDDDHILAVMNGYFSHINQLTDADKAAELQDLCHRMANTMLNIPEGEKALRKSMKGAIKKIGIGAPAPQNPLQEKKGVKASKSKSKNEDHSQALKLQSQIDTLKKQKDDLKVSIDQNPDNQGNDANKKKVSDLEDQIKKLSVEKVGASKNEVKASSVSESLNSLRAMNENDPEELEKHLAPMISELKNLNGQYDQLLNKDKLTDSEETKRKDLSKKRHDLREKIKKERESYHSKHQARRPKLGIVTPGGSYTKSGKRIS